MPVSTDELLKFRVARVEHHLIRLRQVENRFPWIRLGVLLLLLLVIYFAFSLLSFLLASLITLGALGVFIVVALLHRRVIEHITRLEVFQNLLRAHLARLNLDWENIPGAADLTVPPGHPFAKDLDILGERSLHQLLDTCVSLGGSQRLADWLLQPIPNPQQIGLRQALVSELLERPIFRTRLELNGLLARPPAELQAPVHHRWDLSGLLRWLNLRQSTASLRPRLILLSLLALFDLILFLLYLVGGLPPLWAVTLVIYLGLQSLKFTETSEVFGEAYSLARQLERLRPILVDLERTPYITNSRLAEVSAPFWRGPQRPSAALARIGRIVSAASLRNNPFLSLLLNLIMPWDLFFAYQLERYKEELHTILPIWLERWYELEALTALANFAALHPESRFPQLLNLGEHPVFLGKAIGHPLIPPTVRVTNDFDIQQLGQVTIITGSNMSGKSTFLRTLGVNLVLAYAGSPVIAQEFATQPFRLFTSMNLSDSLSDGISFFYAEVRRLKMLLEQLHAPAPQPLFFLIDEIFRGTNNRERQLGSRAYTEALVGGNGVGLISTHDLELAHLSEALPFVQNRHFREDIQAGKMIFDYTLRSGPSPTTNALKIMALAGLPVPDETKNPP